jgi:hypothetical protein
VESHCAMHALRADDIAEEYISRCFG